MDTDHHRINWERFRHSRDGSIRSDDIEKEPGREGPMTNRLRVAEVGREMERALGLEGTSRPVDDRQKTARAPIMSGGRKSRRRLRPALVTTGIVGMIGAGALAVVAGVDSDFLPGLFTPVVQRTASHESVSQRLPVAVSAPEQSDFGPKAPPAPTEAEPTPTPPTAEIARRENSSPRPADRTQTKIERPARPKRVQREPSAIKAAPPVRSAPRCAPGSTDNACIYQDVLNAHKRVAAAYDDAVSAGVPRNALVAARRRWDNARSVSLDAPDEAIRRYDRLARDLRTATDLTRQRGTGSTRG